MKTCSKCSCEKSKTEFHKNKRNKTGISSWCKSCHRDMTKSAYIKNNQTMVGRLKQMLYSKKHDAKKKGFEFDISISDLLPLAFEKCPVLGIPLAWFERFGKIQENSPSIDRVNSDKGYIKGNVAIMSVKANRIKNDATFEELQAVTNWMKAQQ